MAFALQFDGVNDSMTFSSWVATGDFTVSGRINTGSLTGTTVFIGEATSNSYMAFYSDGTLETRIGGGAANPRLAGFLPDTVYNWTMSRVGSTVTLSAEVGSIDFTNSNTCTFSVFGRFPTGLYFDGRFQAITTMSRVGDVRTYDVDSSAPANGTPVLIDTTSGFNATGINMPTDGSAWVDLGGGGTTLTVDSQMPSMLSSIALSVVAASSVSINSTMPSMSASVTASQTEPLRNSSISSVMPSMTSIVNASKTSPGSALSISSIMPSMGSSVSISQSVPVLNASIVSVMPSMLSAISLSQIVSGNALSISSIMPSMQSVIAASKVNPAHDISISSVMPSMTSSFSIDVITPENSASIASVMPSMISDVSLATAEPVDLDVDIVSTMPSMTSSITLLNGDIQAIQNIGISFAENTISVEYLQSNINISYGE